eukprot:m.118093 g.118093  ORF g.118093 m.118093 type:complete len:117 (-) comp13642_c0_seq1:1076-1426(-)
MMSCSRIQPQSPPQSVSSDLAVCLGLDVCSLQGLNIAACVVADELLVKYALETKWRGRGTFAHNCFGLASKALSRARDKNIAMCHSATVLRVLFGSAFQSTTTHTQLNTNEYFDGS